MTHLSNGKASDKYFEVTLVPRLFSEFPVLSSYYHFLTALKTTLLANLLIFTYFHEIN